MTNQNHTLSSIVVVIFLMGLTAFILTWTYNPQPTYTQSDVSALMKFNASEFGCSVSEQIRHEGKLQILCKTYERWNFYQVIDNNLEKYDPCFGGQDVLNESHRIRCNANATHKYFETFRQPQYKTLTYFPQFASVSVVVEPERQECWNETKLKYECVEYIQGDLVHGFTMQEDDKLSYDDVNKVLKQTKNYGYVCRNLSYSKQSCQAIPAVEKEINPWAVGESDLATEFCRAKTYQIEDYRCDKWSEVSCNEKGTACGAGCVENRIINQTKSFTRGEVVEVYYCKKELFGGMICAGNEEIGKYGNYPKQKLIRCSSDDGTIKDFGDVLK